MHVSFFRFPFIPSFLSVILSITMSVSHYVESTSSQAVNTRPNSPALRIHNHPEYYLPGGDLFLLNDATLFRVHSYFFTRESRFWRNLLGNTSKGREANNPIDLHIDTPFVLPPVTAEHFASFLWVFYNPRFSIYETTQEIWLVIQSYAVMWDMQRVLDLAYRELRAYDDDIDNYIDRFNLSSTSWMPLLSEDPYAQAAI